MARPATSQPDTSIRTYRAKRDFTASSEPPPANGSRTAGKAGNPIFVVQKHHAHRAGLHWDFRLEHNDVLWSWAVRKGPSLDPADKRIAAHVEDHPLDYANFQGTIPDGGYGAGTVELWDRGTWQPLLDPDEGLRDGEIKFILHGKRLNGKFTIVRLRPKPNQRGRQDNWLLIKGHDEYEQAGGDALSLEAAIEPPQLPVAKKSDDMDKRPAPAARRRPLPERQSPQLASVADGPPEGDDWLTEIKFDGYRFLAYLVDGEVKLITRNGNDWTDRLPAVAAAVKQLGASSALVDGELVALDGGGMSSFPALQAALADGRDETLFFYVFDLLHLNGWDLRPCALRDRKQLLHGLDGWQAMLRYSDHHDGDTAGMRQAACRMKLEGIICKRGDAPYQAGRGDTWLKVKCQGREEFVVLGWTTPQGTRQGLGSLHVGYYDPDGNLHYVGGVGSGFSDEVLEQLRDALGKLPATPPKGLLIAGDPLERTIHWVKPELVVETSFTAWSGAGRIRHAVYLGLREDKSAPEVVHAVADPDATRRRVDPLQPKGDMRAAPVFAVPPKRSAAHSAAARSSSAIITARAPKARTETIEGVTLTHGDRALWRGEAAREGAEQAKSRAARGTAVTARGSGLTKRDLARYWQTVAEYALPGIARRPMAIVRCPEGVDGEHFFQKHPHGTMPPGIREGVADKAPFLAIDNLQGLVAMAQISAIELHVWGALESDPLHPDQLVFDLDPGDGVVFPTIVAAAHDVREKLEAIGLASFCRTSGGKGLHVVVPLHPDKPWDPVRAFCKRFAEAMSEAQPDKYLSTLKKTDRRNHILIDWLRNGLGSTAVASFSPRARPGAGVATPLAWTEVNTKLDPRAFTIQTVPDRLARLRADPWADFDRSRQPLPDLTGATAAKPAGARPSAKATIVTAKAPAPRRRKR